MDEYNVNGTGNGQQQNNDGEDNNTYTWQNPSPYTNAETENKESETPVYTGYTGYTGYSEPKPPKKPRRKLRGVEIALIAVGGVAIAMFVTVCVLISMLSFDTKDKVDAGNKNDSSVSDSVNNNTEDKQDEVINNNVPDLQTQQAPATGSLSIPQVYEKMKNSVVGIIVTATNGAQIAQGSGTGIILSEDGYIVTNAHVVNGATKIKVVLADETEYDAELIGSDAKTDLAVVKINATGLTAAEIGDSDALVVGETVIAIGNPYGLELAGTVTSGIVSALNRNIVIEGTYMTLIQTDASINPGNSGGPLVNAYGQVIGVTSSKIVTTGYEGIGFAIPITGATEIIEELIQYGYIKNRPFIGIQGSDLDESYAKIYSIPMGVYVQYVDPESDAYKKGLKGGDIITAVDGVEIKSMAELDAEKNKHQPGETITLKVYRNTKYIDISVLLSESSGD